MAGLGLAGMALVPPILKAFSFPSVIRPRGYCSEPHVHTPFCFGAVGDGASDDTRAIQVCIDRAYESGLPFMVSGNFHITETLMVPYDGHGLFKDLTINHQTGNNPAIVINDQRYPAMMRYRMTTLK